MKGLYGIQMNGIWTKKGLGSFWAERIVGAKVLRLAYAVCVCGRRRGIMECGSGGMRGGTVGCGLPVDVLDTRLRNLC